MKSRLLDAVSGCVITVVSLSADAALIPKLGDPIVYDTDLNITWLANANYASPSRHIDTIPTENGDGRMTHAQAVSWADRLFFGKRSFVVPTHMLGRRIY